MYKFQAHGRYSGTLNKGHLCIMARNPGTVCVQNNLLIKSHPYITAKILFPKGAAIEGFHCTGSHVTLRIHQMHSMPTFDTLSLFIILLVVLCYCSNYRAASYVFETTVEPLLTATPKKSHLCIMARNPGPK